MHVHVLGAGTVGQLVDDELRRRGHASRVHAAGPSEGRAFGHALEHEPGDVVIVAAGPAAAVRELVVPAAVAAGVPVVDASIDPGHLCALREAWHERAAHQGVSIVPAAGWSFLLGDLLGAVAAEANPRTEEVHVAYAFPRRRDLLGGGTAGARLAFTEALAGGMLVLRDGAVVEEGLGESRRLAWFPRPIGPHHAVGVPGGEALTLPRHVRGLRTVRTYLAVPSLAAELLQAASRSLRRAGGRGVVARLVARLPEPEATRREGMRWACVAEAPGEAGTARTWAYGTDPYTFAAAALVLTAERLLEHAGAGGVLAPGELGDATTLLDEVTLRAGARWSVSRP